MRKGFLLILFIVSLLAQVAFAQAACDPIRIATGARTLGMGKAFVGLADDAGSVFMNPAGIANPTRWQFTSMSGKLLEEFNYLSFSGLYPTNYGNIGLAYVNSFIGGAYSTTIETGSDLDPIYKIDTTADPMSFSNSLMMLSYGTKLERFLQLPKINEIGKRWPWLNQINFGANLKLFSAGIVGDHITAGNGNASGTELDLGLQGKPLSWLSLGASLQNALPSSLGGKLSYAYGWDEEYPAVLKLGAAFDLLGPQQALRALGGNRLKLLTDVDYEITRMDTVPALWHIGMEWKPMELVALRLGIDQEMSGVREAVSNLTAGVGLYFGDFRFDTAYHQFAGAPGIDNFFFSLTYGITTPAALKERILASPDRLVTIQMVEKVQGLAADPEIVSVKINGLKVPLSLRGDFQTEVSLMVGKNTINLEGFDGYGKLIATKKLRILRLITYPDVSQRLWAYDQINYIGTLGIIKGYPDGKFKPDGEITRAELSALLVRTAVTGEANVPATDRMIFPDVPLAHWAAKYVNLASSQGIVKGYPDKKFRPANNITRAEGLAMIARFGKVKETIYSGTEFVDIDNKHWAAPIIAGAYKEGLLLHFADKPFEPNKNLTRAEAVEMLYRSRPVVSLLNDLKDFEKGY